MGVAKAKMDVLKGSKESVSATELRGVWEAGKIMDTLQESLDSMSGHGSPVIRAAMDSAKGVARNGVYALMGQVMQDYRDSAGARSSKVATFDQVNEIGAQVREIQSIWDGNLVKGSLEETLKVIYPQTTVNTK
jgi:hypothetical protein